MKKKYDKIIWLGGRSNGKVFDYLIFNYDINNGSIIFFVGLTLPRYRLYQPSASLDMNLRQCLMGITPTAKNSRTACFLYRQDQAV